MPESYAVAIQFNIMCSIIFAIIGSYLWVSYKKPYMVLWAVSFILMATRSWMELIRSDYVTLFVALSYSFLIHAAFNFLGVPFRKTVWLYIFGPIALLGILLGAPYYLAVSSILFLITGLCQITVGIRLLKHVGYLDQKLLGICFLVWGVSRVAYPFFRDTPFTAMFHVTSGIFSLFSFLLMVALLMKTLDNKFFAIFQNARDPILFLSEEGRILEANKAATDMYGYSVKEFKGMKKSDLRWRGERVNDQLLESTDCGMLYEDTHVDKAGYPLEVEVSTKGSDLNGEMILVSIIRDISTRKRIQSRLEYLSLRDSLTGLYNRNHFQMLMEQLEEREALNVGIAICDVDALKLVNDTLGHDAGDALLAEASGLLSACLPESVVIARVGGDEFAVIVEDTTRDGIMEISRIMRDAVDGYVPRDPRLTLRMSIGHAIRETLGQTMFGTFKEADYALYRDKIHHSGNSKFAVIQTLIDLLAERDHETEQHTSRLQSIVTDLGNRMGLNSERVAELSLFARFHDIGKVGIPDRVLLKAGPLTPDERTAMERHSEIGYRIAAASPDLKPIAEWILRHHEWWNGSGYPMRIKQDEIPLECRILAVADAFDAMTNDRPYRKALSSDEAMWELKKWAGTQFDPVVVELFEAVGI